VWLIGGASWRRNNLIRFETHVFSIDPSAKACEIYEVLETHVRPINITWEGSRNRLTDQTLPVTFQKGGE